jgi:hypothetical protein
MSRSHVVEQRRDDSTAQDLIDAVSAAYLTSKDDNDLGAKEEFAHNNFWRKPDAYDISELLHELLE